MILQRFGNLLSCSTSLITGQRVILNGNWLEEAGFTTGQAVKVTVERRQLIIQLAEE
ncbi:SymE family type I addiction module toxin [Pantoea sp. C2G6]|uniref:SymE family type I addiction module toxin n=1 Tax=Pantoea sp. C2G6 TaxID=3243084 RepID=UPI003EDA899D